MALPQPPESGILKDPKCPLPNGWYTDLEAFVAGTDVAQTTYGVRCPPEKGICSRFTLRSYGLFQTPSPLPDLEWFLWLTEGGGWEIVANGVWQPPVAGTSGLVVQQDGFPSEALALSLRWKTAAAATARWGLRITAVRGEGCKPVTTFGRYVIPGK